MINKTKLYVKMYLIYLNLARQYLFFHIMIGQLPLPDSWNQLQQTLVTPTAEEAGTQNGQMDTTEELP